MLTITINCASLHLTTPIKIVETGENLKLTLYFLSQPVLRVTRRRLPKLGFVTNPNTRRSTTNQSKLNTITIDTNIKMSRPIWIGGWKRRGGAGASVQFLGVIGEYPKLERIGKLDAGNDAVSHAQVTWLITCWAHVWDVLIFSSYFIGTHVLLLLVIFWWNGKAIEFKTFSLSLLSLSPSPSRLVFFFLYSFSLLILNS